MDNELRAAAAREYVRGLTADERHQFEVETRPPVTAEQLKSVAARVLSDSQAAAWVDSVDPSKLTNNEGAVDEVKVMGHLTALFGVQPQQPKRRDWGQSTGAPQGKFPGAAGRAEAEKRFRLNKRATAVVNPGAAAAPPGAETGPGARGLAEARRRFGKAEK